MAGIIITHASPVVPPHHAAPVSFVGPYELSMLLGTGATGRVWLGVHYETGQKVAIKIICKKQLAFDKDLSDKVEREIAIMKLINHPHVLALYDVYESEHNLFLVLEYVAGGELFEHLARRGRLPVDEALWYFQQIISAIDFCHHHYICHRDLKPENLLLDEHNNIKIADFGMAALQTGSDMLSQSCGSPHYASPEVIRGVPYDGKAADVWSCGVILYALLTGGLPFDDENLTKLLTKVKIGVFKIPDYVPSEVQVLIRRILVVNPAKRYSIEDIKRNPWFLSNGRFERLPRPPVYTNLPPISRIEPLDEDVLFSLKSLRSFEDLDVLRDALASSESLEKVLYYLLLERKVSRPAVADKPQPAPAAMLSSGYGRDTIRKRTDSSLSLDQAAMLHSQFLCRTASQPQSAERTASPVDDDDNPLGLKLHPTAPRPGATPVHPSMLQFPFRSKPAPLPDAPIEKCRVQRNRQNLRLRNTWRTVDESADSSPGGSGAESPLSEHNNSPRVGLDRYLVPNSPKRSWFGSLFKQSRRTRVCESKKPREVLDYELPNLFQLSNVEWKMDAGSYKCRYRTDFLDYGSDGENWVKLRVEIAPSGPGATSLHTIFFSYISGSSTLFTRVAEEIINGMRILQLKPLPSPKKHDNPTSTPTSPQKHEETPNVTAPMEADMGAARTGSVASIESGIHIAATHALPQ